MRVLVSGSNGFVGRALVARLEEEGHTVHRLVRHAPRPGEAFFDAVAGRVDASTMPGGTLGGLDAAVNLAGEPMTPARWGPAKRQRIFSSRVRTTEVLASVLASCASPPAVLVSGSAIGYYGNRGDEVLAEGCRPGAGFLARLCSAWEQATAPAALAGVRVVALRSGLVLGAGGGLLARLLPWFRAGLGGRLGDGRQWMSWISLEDEVGVIIHALTHPSVRGAINATSRQPVRNSEFTSALAAAVGRPALLPVPATAIRLALGRQTADELVLASQRVVPERLIASGYSFLVPSLEQAIVSAVRGTSLSDTPSR